METIKNKTTLVGIVTLIVGLALGVGIGVWGVRDMHASNTPAAKAESTSKIDKGSSFSTRVDDWDPFRRMEQMREEIDRAIRNATEHFELGASTTVSRLDAGYSSQFDLRDRKDHFELRAYLPDAEASDVKVKIDNNETLHVSVTHRKQEVKKGTSGEANFTQLGQYEQVVTLPEPVKSDEMKIDRKNHEVVITIPKARSA